MCGVGILSGSIPILQLAPIINGSIRLSESERNVFAHLGCSLLSASEIDTEIGKEVKGGRS
jgi:hypothetical protein